MRQEAGLLDEEHFTQALETMLSMATEDLYDARAHVCRYMVDVAPSRIVTCGSSAGVVTVPMDEYRLCNGPPLTVEKLTQNFNCTGVIVLAGAVCDTRSTLRRACNPAPMPFTTAMPTAT